LIFGFPDPVSNIVFDDPHTDGVGEHRAGETYTFAGRASAAAQDGFAMLLCFPHRLRLPGDDVVHHFRHIGLCQVLNAALSYRGYDVATQLALVHIDRRWPLGATAFAHDEASVHRFDIAFGKFTDRHRVAVCFSGFRWVLALCDLAQLNPSFLPRRVWRPNAMKADTVTARSTGSSVLENVAAFSRLKDAQSEAGEFVVPDDVV
jgi:hypothetical protein